MPANNVINIDFETFSECDIACGPIRYAQDPSTRVLCMAYSFNGGPVNLWTPDKSFPRSVLTRLTINKWKIRAWNVSFEYAILKYVLKISVDFDQCLCTMTDALALALPASLGECGEVLNVDTQKDKEGKRLIRLLCVPQKPRKNQPHRILTPELAPEEFKKLYAYCVQDVATEISIFKNLPKHVQGSELLAFQKTMEINERGIPIDVQLLNAIMEDKEEYLKKINAEAVSLTNGELASTNSRPQSLKWLKKNGLNMEGYTKLDIQKALALPDMMPKVKRFLEIRSEMSRTPIKKFDYLVKALCNDDTIKNNLFFHKSTTGRFSSTGYQMQNIPRDSQKSPEETEALINRFISRDPIGDRNINNEAITLLRAIFLAPKHHKLVVSDFSGIENRVVAWLSGDNKTLNDFRKGVDQYKDAATSIFNVKYDEVTKDQRQLGKISVLSCCYGGGSKTFHTICNDGWGITISEELSKEVVDAYRKKYHRVVALWYGLLNAAHDAVINKGTVYTYGYIKFKYEGDFLYMRLPSKRLLAYYKPRIELRKTPWGTMKDTLTHMGHNTYTRKWERLGMSPGRLTENATQATARDVLNSALMRAEKAGFKTIGLVHDEIIAISNKKEIGISLLNKIMSEPIEWCKSLPLDAEGYEAKRYKK